MKKILMLCLIAFVVCGGCVSKRLALRQSNDVSKTHNALSNASAAVVLIISTCASYTPLKYSEACNGFIISEDGYILSVSHGLSYNMPVVYVDDERFGAEIVYNNKKYDFAILKITALRPLPFLHFARETSLKQNVYLMGRFRKNREVFISKGSLNAKGINLSSKEVNWVSTNIGEKRKVDYAIQNGIIHSARFFEGLSGCPLLDDNGDVIGMNSDIIGSEERRITLASDVIGFLPIIQQYSSSQIPQTTVDSSDFSVDLNDPVKRLDWVMKGIFQYCSLLGKKPQQLEEVRNRIEKQAKEKILSQKSQDKPAIQWAWKTFLSEAYALK
jgi:S1-C subfamily serine protease